MLMKEFIDRTGYEPSFEEYEFIEESYYEFDGQKDAFCAWWKKANKSGEWKKELRLRRALKEQKERFKQALEEKQETIDFYRPYFQRALNAEALLDMKDKTVNVTIKLKDKRTSIKYNGVRVVYISKSYNGSFDFINVIEKSGWTTSHRIFDIEAIMDVREVR